MSLFLLDLQLFYISTLSLSFPITCSVTLYFDCPFSISFGCSVTIYFDSDSIFSVACSVTFYFDSFPFFLLDVQLLYISLRFCLGLALGLLVVCWLRLGRWGMTLLLKVKITWLWRCIDGCLYVDDGWTTFTHLFSFHNSIPISLFLLSLNLSHFFSFTLTFLTTFTNLLTLLL